MGIGVQKKYYSSRTKLKVEQKPIKIISLGFEENDVMIGTILILF
jgi:hypothetical protein